MAAPTVELDHPTGSELTGVVLSSGGVVIDIPKAKPRCTGALGWVEKQVRLWGIIREAGRRAEQVRHHQVAYANDGDSWYWPCVALGAPIKGMPLATVLLRIRYHHAPMGYGEDQNRLGSAVQKRVVESLLKRKQLAAVLTPDRSLEMYYLSATRPILERPHYIPEIAETIRPMNRQAARTTLGLRTDRRLIACFGALSDRKGIVDLIGALREDINLRGIGCFLMGSIDAPLASFLRAAPNRELLIRGQLWIREGPYTAPDRDAALSACDAVWLGYKGHPFSSAVLWEAAGSGLPVVGCDKGLIAWEILHNDIGEVVNVESAASVARGLRKVVSDDVDRSRWHSNCLQVGAMHTAERFGNGVVDDLEVQALKAASA